MRSILFIAFIATAAFQVNAQDDKKKTKKELTDQTYCNLKFKCSPSIKCSDDTKQKTKKGKEVPQWFNNDKNKDLLKDISDLKDRECVTCRLAEPLEKGKKVADIIDKKCKFTASPESTGAKKAKALGVLAVDDDKKKLAVLITQKRGGKGKGGAKDAKVNAKGKKSAASGTVVNYLAGVTTLAVTMSFIMA